MVTCNPSKKPQTSLDFESEVKFVKNIYWETFRHKKLRYNP